MRMLELFSGTGRLAAAFRELGWETVTLDSQCKADINCEFSNGTTRMCNRSTTFI